MLVLQILYVSSRFLNGGSWAYAALKDGIQRYP